MRKKKIYVPFSNQRAMNVIFSKCQIINQELKERGISFTFYADEATLSYLMKVLLG